MPRILSFVIFITVALGVYFSLHLFVFWRLSSGLALNASQRGILKIVFITGALAFPLAEFLSRFTWSVPLLYGGFVWLGLLSIGFTIFIIEWLAGFFLADGHRAAVIVSLFAVFALGFYSLLKESRYPVLREIRIPVQGLAERHNGFTIVQLSDLHLGFHTPTARIKWMVDKVNEMNPDLVVVTGDLMDRDICQHERFCTPLAEFRARYGVYAVTGNHEYYAGIKKFEELAARTGIHILGNQSVRIGDVLTLAGLNDNEGWRFLQGGPDLDKALSGVDRDLPLILLYHRPFLFPEAQKRGVRLQLSGHTHAGQIPPADLIVWLTYAYPFGLYKKGESCIYTTCGSGTWGPPMRLFSRSEITKITLCPK